jgi:hypothetical protein
MHTSHDGIVGLDLPTRTVITWEKQSRPFDELNDK